MVFRKILPSNIEKNFVCHSIKQREKICAFWFNDDDDVALE